MTFFEIAQVLERYREPCEDRIGVIEEDHRTVIVVADGAGGIGNGDVAAETVVHSVRSVYHHVDSAEQWVAELRHLDFRIGTGESTAVVVDLRPDRIIGASVGDSIAWISEDGEISDLTANQIRKPLLGSQAAHPVAFSRIALGGLLIVASDGFGSYVKRKELSPLVVNRDFYTIPRACVEMVRLPSGDLWDDTAVVVCRVRPRPRTRQRYVL